VPIVFSSNVFRLGVVTVVVVAVLAALLLGGGNGSSSSSQTILRGGGSSPGAPAAPRFNLSFPSAWTAVPVGQLATYAGHPVAVLLRAKHTGLIVITGARSNPSLTLTQLGPSISKKITSSFKDARTVSAKLVTVPAGKAFYYSFVRTKAGTVNALMVVPAGTITYQLNSVVPGDQPLAAREIGKIFLSFTLS
jgi:hypothetical protein